MTGYLLFSTEPVENFVGKPARPPRNARPVLLRASLPADPATPRPLNEGEYYTEPRSFVSRLLNLRNSIFGGMNLEALVDISNGRPVR